jgi:hypothetical protein
MPGSFAAVPSARSAPLTLLRACGSAPHAAHGATGNLSVLMADGQEYRLRNRLRVSHPKVLAVWSADLTLQDCGRVTRDSPKMGLVCNMSAMA